jgi:hypothetical protein
MLGTTDEQLRAARKKLLAKPETRQGMFMVAPLLCGSFTVLWIQGESMQGL